MKTFEITGLTADQMANVITHLKGDALANRVAKQFTDQMLGGNVATRATPAKAASTPAPAKAAPAKQSDDQRKAKAAKRQRDRRAAKKLDAAKLIPAKPTAAK